MEIIVDNRIRDTYNAGLDRDGKSVTEITIHSTAGGGDTIGWMVKGGYMGKDTNGVAKYRKDDYKKSIGLFHYHISKAGLVTEIIDPTYYVYHSSSGTHDKYTIGIELEKDHSNNSDTPTDIQYNTLREMISYLKNKFPTITTLASHDYNAKYYSNRPPKPCPGTFDWNKLADLKLVINK